MIIKATRLQAWAPAGGGGGKSRPSPPPLEKILGLYWGPFCYFFFIWGPFCYFFFIWGPFWHVFLIFGAFWLLFTSWCRPFLGLPPPPTKISAGAHDCKEGSRACSPEIFLCDRNLVSSGHVLLRVCLKNEKYNDKL